MERKNIEIEKVALVFPPSNIDGVGIEDAFIPNGLLTLKRQFEIWRRGLEIFILDGSVLSNKEIANKLIAIEPDIACFSSLAGNYRSTQQLLDVCKCTKSTTIVGNHHANYLYEILKKKEFLDSPHPDYIVTGNNDFNVLEPLLNCIEKNTPVTGIENLCFKDKKSDTWILPEEISYKQNSFCQMPPILLDNYDRYFENYRRIFGRFHVKGEEIRPININLVKGCRQGDISPCIYCCLKDHKFLPLAPKKFWEYIEYLYDRGFNYFFETANSFTSLKDIYHGHNQNYLQALVQMMPDRLKNKIDFMIYGRVDELDLETVKILKELQVHRIIMGFDSGDYSVLKKGIGKIGIREGQNYRVAKLLNQFAIQVYACYVPGGIGETKGSLMKTRNEIFNVMKLSNCCTIEYTSLAPMPGSRAWSSIKNDYHEEYGITDLIDISELSKFWIKRRVPTVKWEWIERVKEEIRDEAKRLNLTFGGYY